MWYDILISHLLSLFSNNRYLMIISPFSFFIYSDLFIKVITLMDYDNEL